MDHLKRLGKMECTFHVWVYVLVTNLWILQEHYFFPEIPSCSQVTCSLVIYLFSFGYDCTLLGTRFPTFRRYRVSSMRREPFTQWRGVMPQRNRVLDHRVLDHSAVKGW